MDEIPKAAALIRQQFQIDPWQLSDQEFAERFSEAQWLKRLEAQQMESAFYNAIAKAFGEP